MSTLCEEIIGLWARRVLQDKRVVRMFSVGDLTGEEEGSEYIMKTIINRKEEIKKRRRDKKYNNYQKNKKQKTKKKKKHNISVVAV